MLPRFGSGSYAARSYGAEIYHADGLATISLLPNLDRLCWKWAGPNQGFDKIGRLRCQHELEVGKMKGMALQAGFSHRDDG
jgi:hypothetical protein